MGGESPKQFIELSGKPILAHTLDMLCGSGLLAGLLLVAPPDFLDRTVALVEAYCRGREGCSFQPLSGSSAGKGEVSLSVVAGGAERQDSVYNALVRLPVDCDWVMIHDGVRPFASARLLRDTLEAAVETGAAITAVDSSDTVKRVDGERVLETLPREQIRLVQTPQVFRKDILFEAYGEARRRGWRGTDDASFVERLGIAVTVVRGERTNIKITTPDDLAWAEWLLARRGRASGVASAVTGGGAGNAHRVRI